MQPSPIFSSACWTPLARDIAGDRRIVALTRDLVDLVDIDDAGLRALDVAVGRLDEPRQDVLDILADIARLGERGGIGDCKGHLEHAGQRLGQQRLAAAGGPQQQHIALAKLDIIHVVASAQPLVVVVDRHRQHHLGAVLADHILVEPLGMRLGVGRRVGPTGDVRCATTGGTSESSAMIALAECHALVADKYGAGAGDQALYLILAPATK